MINEITTTSTANASTGELKTGNPGKDGGEMAKGLGDGGTGGDQAARNEKTAELLHEATQLLRNLKGPHSNPTLKVMQLEGLNRVENEMTWCSSIQVLPTHYALQWIWRSGTKLRRPQFSWQMGPLAHFA